MDLNLPDLPLKQYHRFLTTIGAIVAVLSLFVDTTFLPSRAVFEMGATAFGFGLAGWILENFWSEFSHAKNMDWMRVVQEGDWNETPYENLRYSMVTLSLVVSLSRILLIAGFFWIEAQIYFAT